MTVIGIVPPPPSSVTLLRPVAMGLAQVGAMLPAGYGVAPTDQLNSDYNLPAVEPFHEFALAPGEDRAIYVWMRMGNCEYNQAGSAETLLGVTVRYKVGGDARQAELRLPMGIRVDVPLDVTCPRTRPGQA